MYSQQAEFSDNRVVANLLGSALMNSDRLVLRNNRIERHREGSAAYGILLKDIGDLIAEGNTIVGNRVGLYAEGVPSRPDREAIVRNNLIAGNEVALALQSTAALTMTGNRIADNLTDVRPLGRQLSSSMKWSKDGRGNAWKAAGGAASRNAARRAGEKPCGATSVVMMFAARFGSCSGIQKRSAVESGTFGSCRMIV